MFSSKKAILILSLSVSNHPDLGLLSNAKKREEREREENFLLKKVACQLEQKILPKYFNTWVYKNWHCREREREEER